MENNSLFSTTKPNGEIILEKTLKELKYDFSFIDKITVLTPEQQSIQLLELIGKWIADPVRKNNHHIWRKLLSDSDVEKIICKTDFRKKAALLFKNAVFTPEAASAIASGFGKGSKAVHCEKDDVFISEENKYNTVSSYTATSDDTIQKWRVLISDGTGKPVKSKPILPSYARAESGFSLKISDAVICIIIAAILIMSVRAGV